MLHSNPTRSRSIALIPHVKAQASLLYLQKIRDDTTHTSQGTVIFRWLLGLPEEGLCRQINPRMTYVGDCGA